MIDETLIARVHDRTAAGIRGLFQGLGGDQFIGNTEFIDLLDADLSDCVCCLTRFLLKLELGRDPTVTEFEEALRAIVRRIQRRAEGGDE